MVMIFHSKFTRRRPGRHQKSLEKFIVGGINEQKNSGKCPTSSRQLLSHPLWEVQKWGPSCDCVVDMRAVETGKLWCGKEVVPIKVLHFIVLATMEYSNCCHCEVSLKFGFDINSGWWFGTWLLFFPYIGNVIIPTDFHSIIFQRGWLKPPTRNWCSSRLLRGLLLPGVFVDPVTPGGWICCNPPLYVSIIELDDGKIYRKPLYLMVKTMANGFL